MSYLSAIVLAAGVLSLAYRHLVLSRGTPEEESVDVPDEADPAADEGVRHLAPGAGLFGDRR